MENSRDKLITIGDRQFIISKYDALTALKVKGQLLALLAPVLGNALSDTSAFSSGNAQAMGTKLLTFLPQLDMDKTTDLLVQICQSARYGQSFPELAGKHVDFNHAFDDDLMPAYELAIEIVQFNFAKYVKDISQRTATAIPTDTKA